MAQDLPKRTVEQLVFSEAVRRNLKPREFAYLFARAGTRDPAFAEATKDFSFDSPAAAGDWLKYIPPVSVPIGPYGISADGKSLGQWAWTLTAEASATAIDARIEEARANSPWIDQGLGAMVRSAFDKNSEMPRTLRQTIIDSYNTVRQQNAEVPAGDASMHALMGIYGAGTVDDFFRTYLLRNGTDEEVAKAVSKLDDDKLTLDQTTIEPMMREVVRQATDALAKTVRETLQDEAAQARQRTERSEQERFDRTVREAAGGMAIAAGLAHIFGQEGLSRTITRATDPVIKIANGIGEFLKSDGLKLAASGNIVAGALALVSLFGGGEEPDPMLSGILQNTQTIMRQLDQVFDVLGSMQSQLRQLSELSQKILDRQEELAAEIKAGIEQVRAELIGTRQEMRDDLRAIATSDLMTAYTSACQLFDVPAVTEQLAAGEISEAVLLRFSEALNSQVDLGTRVAMSAPLRGSTAFGVKEIANFTSAEPWVGKMPSIAAWVLSTEVLEAAGRWFRSQASPAPFDDDDVYAKFTLEKLAEYLTLVDPADFSNLPDPDAWYLGIAQFLELDRFIPRTMIDPTRGLAALAEQGLRLVNAVHFLVRVAPIAYAVWRYWLRPVSDIIVAQRDASTRDATQGRLDYASLFEPHSFSNAIYAGLLFIDEGGEIDFGKKLDERDRPPDVTLNEFKVEVLDDEERQKFAPATLCVTLQKGVAIQYQPVSWTDQGRHILQDVMHVEVPQIYGRLRAFDASKMSEDEKTQYCATEDEGKRAILERAKALLAANPKDPRVNAGYAALNSTVDAMLDTLYGIAKQRVETDFRALVQEDTPAYPPLKYPEMREALSNLTVAHYALRVAVGQGLGGDRARSRVFDRVANGRFEPPDFPVVAFPGRVIAAHASADEALNFVDAAIAAARGVDLPGVYFNLGTQKAEAVGPWSLRAGVNRLRAFAIIRPDVEVQNATDLIAKLDAIEVPE